jgi:hypothetical protein
MAYFNATTALLAARDPLKVLANEEKHKVQQIEREVAQQLRSPLPPSFTFVPCAANSRGMLGPQLQKLLHQLAEYAASHRGLGVLDDNAEETKGRLLDRWQARLAGAAVRSLMEEYAWRADKVFKRLAREAGGERLTAVDLRFQGGGHIGGRGGGEGGGSGDGGSGGGGSSGGGASGSGVGSAGCVVVVVGVVSASVAVRSGGSGGVLAVGAAG